MTDILKIISPIDGVVVAERPTASDREIEQAIVHSERACSHWQKMPITERATICYQAVEYMLAHSDDIAREICIQMGRPQSQCIGAVRGMAERAKYMIAIAEHELCDIKLMEKAGYKRFIRREPLGLSIIIAPWNYPYLTAINALIPALMAGNTVILKHAQQTLLCAERFQQAFASANCPEGVFQSLHLDHGQTEKLIKHPAVQFVSFTGSVNGGVNIERSVAGLFKHLALELGGKDPAYVREDVNLDYAVESLVDGAFYNSGQSCCGIERIYVHARVYDNFLESFCDLVKAYKLGNPLNKNTTLGPMVSAGAADTVRQQIQVACEAGATRCINHDNFNHDKFMHVREGSPYLAPQVLVNVDHSMSIMRDESFGPVVGIMKVHSDDEALSLMNDSPYGLTASIWTESVSAAERMGDAIHTGTVFMNRCDYLDPELAWVGVKNSGRGCALSKLGYQQVTRPKSFHLKIV